MEMSVHIDQFEGKRAGFFFLTHWHSDHTAGLTASWAKGPLFCSQLTKEILLRARPCIREDRIKVLVLGKKTWLGKGKKRTMSVTSYDANHIRGSIMLLFETRKTGKRTLYTGDYRFKVGLLVPTEVSMLYLDKTFQSSGERHLSLQQSTDLANKWIEDGGRNIGYIHVGTCTLLQNLFDCYGYTFHPMGFTDETQNICSLMYPEIWDETSCLRIYPVWKKKKIRPLYHC